MLHSDLLTAEQAHSALLREWLSARGPAGDAIRDELEKARERHRTLEAAQCAAWARGGWTRERGPGW